MSKSEITEPKKPFQQSVLNMAISSMISLTVFSFYLYNRYDGAFSFDIVAGFGILLPFFMGWILLIIIRENLGFRKHETINRSLTSLTAYSLPIINNRMSEVSYYYPEIKTKVSPILSIPDFFNGTAIIFIVPYAVIHGIIFGNATEPLLLSLLVLAVCWLVFATININSLIKVIMVNKSNIPAIVNIDYSSSYIDRLLKSQSVFYYTDKEKKVDLLAQLYKAAVIAGNKLNELILTKGADSAMLDNEIKTIEHISNYFVVTTINSTKNFFDKHKDKRVAAERIYMRDVAPDVRREAFELKDKLTAINLTIISMEEAQAAMEADREKQQLLLDEQSIAIDSDLIALTQRTTLTVSDFPEFNELYFKNMEKRTAAKNIVLGALTQLVEAKKKAIKLEEQQKLDNQIGRVKTFVRSLASGTPESVAREARLKEQEKQDALYISADTTDVNDIEHIIAVNERYITSYDNTLPINNS